MRIVVFTVVAAVVLGIQGSGQKTDASHLIKDNNVLSRGMYVAKGGIGGIVQGHLYIALKSARNELVLKDGKIWTGRSAGAREIVMFFEDKIWLPPDLPKGFDLSKSVVISFEGDIVRFFRFDVDQASGGYYERPPSK